MIHADGFDLEDQREPENKTSRPAKRGMKAFNESRETDRRLAHLLFAEKCRNVRG